MENPKIKLIRSTTVPGSLNTFCEGMLKELSEKYEVIALSSPGTEMDIISRREGVRTITVPMRRHISPVKDIISLCYLVQAFWRERPTMVHSMTPKAGLLCMLAAWITRVPVRIHTFTGLVWPTTKGLKRKILMTTDWLTCACATHIIPEGEGVKNDLLSHSITKKPIRVLGYGNIRGIDMKIYSRRPEVMEKALQIFDKNAFTFLFVGRLVKDKGINELCKAFNLLSEIEPVRLILIGNYEETLDPISDEARKIIAENPAVEAVGPKFGDDLLAYYAAADCFVFPSYREGFPNVVIEAGAMELPSIVTDINGSREIIKQGENGVIIPSEDDMALFNAMVNMIRDKVMRERMAKNARGMIASRFEQSLVRKCLYDFYDKILASKLLKNL